MTYHCSQSSDRAMHILKMARRILRAGWARGWSEALKLAREQVSE
jgi:hypothetical protein